LLHNEFGIPAQPSLTTLTAKLIEGPTLRPRSGKGTATSLEPAEALAET